MIYLIQIPCEDDLCSLAAPRDDRFDIDRP